MSDRSPVGCPLPSYLPSLLQRIMYVCMVVENVFDRIVGEISRGVHSTETLLKNGKTKSLTGRSAG